MMTLSKKIITEATIALMGTGAIGMIVNAQPHFDNITAVAHADSAQPYIALHHKSGILKLRKPIKAYDSRNGNQSTVIPKGQVLHYQADPDGVVVWGGKYPKNSDHHYEIVDNPEVSSKANDKKSAAKDVTKDGKGNKQPKGTANIAKANARKRANNKQSKAKQLEAKRLAAQRAAAIQKANKNKKNLPRTADVSPSNRTYRIVASVLAATVGYLLGYTQKIFKKIRNI